MDEAFKRYQNEALKAAMDLQYSYECKQKIINATSFGEIERAMKTERRNRKW